MPIDGYRSQPPELDPPPSRRFEVDEVTWALLCMAAFAGLRIALGLLRHEGPSDDVVRAVEVLVVTLGFVAYRVLRGQRAREGE